jgi:hypothetical protein
MPRQRRKSRTCPRASLESLEARQFLSAVSHPTWNISFNDPGGTWSAYYANITKVIKAAGQEWGQLFNSTASIEITVGFDNTLATAYGRSLTTSYLYHSADGLDIYEQGVASEINTGIDPNGASPDAQFVIGVKPGANYLADTLWFDPDPASRTAPIPDGKVDALSVMLHEMGHVIGYNGWRDPNTGQLPASYASTFDQYIYQSGSDFFFSGAFAHEIYGADPSLAPGQLYHWGSAGSAPGTDLPHQLMNGQSIAAQTRYEISPLDVAVMNDIGMNIEIDPPAVVASQFLYDTSQRITIQFDQSVRSTLDLSDFTLTRVGPGTSSIVPSAALALSYDRATDTATLSFPGLGGGVLPDGNYQLTLSAAGVRDLAGNTLAADATLNFFTLAGDANHDRTVNFADLVAVAQHYGQTTGATFATGDFNYDGAVNFADLVTVAQRYGQSLAEPAAALPPAAPLPADAASEIIAPAIEPAAVFTAAIPVAPSAPSLPPPAIPAPAPVPPGPVKSVRKPRRFDKTLFSLAPRIKAVPTQLRHRAHHSSRRSAP